MLRQVIVPQAARRMLPPFVNQSITQLKNTALVSTGTLCGLRRHVGFFYAHLEKPRRRYRGGCSR
jgi:ABC-type amino acid transport system permease subunit